jgi:hypothetical protein
VNDRRFRAVVLTLALVLAASAAVVASRAPDGLETVADRHGITAAEPLWPHAPLADTDGSGGVIAGVIGTLLVLGAAFGLGRLLRRRA